MTFTFKPAFLAATLGFCGAAQADSAASFAQMTPLLEGMKSIGEAEIMSGAIAACYLGTGNRAMLEELMVIEDWEIYEPSEGALAYTPFVAPNLIVTIYADGAFCDVENTALTITQMQEAVVTAFDKAGVFVELQEEDTGCYVALVEDWHDGTLVGRISSNGQDPVCVSDAAGANIRFEGFN